MTRLLLPLLAAYALGWALGLRDGLRANVCAACDAELRSCADELGEAEQTLIRAQHAVQVAEIVMETRR